MSPEDQPPEVRSVSRVEDRERLLAEATAHAEALEQQHRISFPDGPSPRKWKGPVALLVFAVAAWFAAFPLEGRTPDAPPAAELERGLRVALYLQARQIDVFRAREGRLPSSLDEVTIRLGDLRFVRSNSRVYQLVGRRPDGSVLVYDSARRTDGLDRVVGSWLGIDEP